MAREAASGKSATAGITRSLVLAVITLFDVVEALGFLGFESLSGLVSELLVFASHIFFGLVILSIGRYSARVVPNAIGTNGTSQA